MVKLVGIGVGGSSKVIFDVIKQYDFEFIGWFDDSLDKIGTYCLDYPVLDTIQNISKYKNDFDKVIICIGSTKNTIIRNQIFDFIKSQNIKIATLISKNSIVSTKVIGEGCIILDGVIINSNVVLHDNVFLNTGCVVEHDCEIGKSSFIAPRAVLCGNVKIKDNVFVGANSTIIGNLTVENNCTIGAGTVIIKNIKSNSTVVGNPGRIL